MKSYEEKAADKKIDTFEEIMRSALALPAGARAVLADHLLESLDGPDQKEIDAAWAEEIERRIREIDEGRVKLIPGDEGLAELRSQFR